MGTQLVIARGGAAKLFKVAEEPLDGVALGIALRLVGALVPALIPGRNHGAGATPAKATTNASKS